MKRQRNLKRNLLICLLAGSAVMYTLPLHAATSVIANNALPQGWDSITNNHKITSGGLEMNITQTGQNGVIKWDSFNVGGNATVNFKAEGDYANNFNTLNYVDSGAASQIYGTINGQGGNIFIVNTAGVQIGPSAQINVGSLHVSNKYLNEGKLGDFDGAITPEMIDATQTADAALMSLGNINATNVTFEGSGRIVIDSERITNDTNNATFRVNTNDAGNVIIGYDAYVETDKDNDGVADGYKGQDRTFSNNVYVNGNLDNTVKGYMWVEDVEQLQAINTNLGGNYALRNSIDATSTEAAGNEFSSLGIKQDGSVDNDGKGFTGKFDGIDYNIFDLNINDTGSNTGLFGYTDGATINNVTLVGGNISGTENVGAVVGNANNTTITNVTNSATVNGKDNVGGIVGRADNTLVQDAINTGTITGNANVGGLVGNLQNSKFVEATGDSEEVRKGLLGNSYNLGAVTGDGYNVGGLVGYAENSTIGDGTNLVYNRLDVEGKYNVGGIVGNMDGTTVQNAENSGNVTATGYTTEEYTYHTGETVSNNIPNGTLNGDGTVTTSVNVANVGGIAGTASNNSTIKDVTNSADVSSNTSTYTQNGKRNIYYTAGNVGGIVGRAENTDINNATNKENTIRGAHNVGGVAGYFGNTDDADKIYTVNTGINDGGDIMATGARNSNGFVKELVRPVGGSNESFIIGNIGGIVGYMDGDDVFVTASGNRGTVHSQDIAQEDAENVLDTSKAANVGGVVGKIDRSDTEDISTIKQDETKAAVSNSYNTGDVRGYTGVGGVVGMMYNGEVAGSYNLGNLRTTRIATNSVNIEAVNMGGIVGDTTEGSKSQGVVIYDVYNKGQIGDDTYTYYARHVAGIVGRLSGDVEKAYNNGEIYNGYTATGGIVGWMYEGNIKNAFNTGNITVYNHDSSTSQVGGIVGAAGVANGDINLTNVYNLGTLRSFKAVNDEAISGVSHNVGDNSVAGIIGAVLNNQHKLIINGAYTTGNIYAGIQQKDGSIIADGGYTVMDGTNIINNIHVGSIYSENRGEDNKQAQISLTNTYYIAPQKELQDNGYFQDLSEVYAGNGNNVPWIDKDNSNKAIDYVNRSDKDEYKYDNDTGKGSLNFSSQSGGNVTGDTDDNWRLYDDTPILNAFLPDSEKYFDQYGDDSTLKDAGMDKVQYGTAYDPLLTIVTANDKANGNLTFEFGNSDDGKLTISNAAGLVVHKAGLTLNGFTTSGGSGYYGGLIYSDGQLIINAVDGEGLGFGSGSDLYGSSVTLNADGTVTVYGDVVATGNGTKTGDNLDEAGSINITSKKGDVNVYGTLTSAQAGGNVVVPGISATADTEWKPADSVDKLNDPKAHLNTIGDRFEVDTDKSAFSGNINITAKGVKDDKGELISGGNVNLYYGNKEEGLITTGGNLTVTGDGDVYVDSDLNIGGDLTLTGNGANSEVVLDLTNIGQVQAKNELEKDPNSIVTAVDKLHNFMHHFNKNDADGANINLKAEKSKDTKITVDMWDGKAFNLKKFDSTSHNFKQELDSMNVTINGNKIDGTEGNHVKDYTYIWVSDGEQLQGINNTGADGLDFNYALKGDINASDVQGYEAIGGTTGFTGTFDGRGNRIIGLDTTKDENGGNTNSMTNAGIFSTIGEGGTVKNVNIYSGNFEGTNTAGAVAGMNSGRIENVTGFGNTVTVTGDTNNAGNAGGIVGVNNGTGTFNDNNDSASTLIGYGIYDVQSIGSVIAGNNKVVAGGLVGTNNGSLGNSYSDSAVTSTAGTTEGLGGVVGVNNVVGNVQYVDSLGVTNGGTNSNKVGGIIGVNNGNMYSGYNESIVTGNNNVGGIIGVNSEDVTNIVNATGVEGHDYVGGLIGDNAGNVTDGRNNGTITGNEYVGGMVGSNADGSQLKNLTNGESADITGENYVGGIAGTNAGTITAQNQANLINRGSITGQNYVGGVAGENIGTIEYVKNDVSLNVKDSTKEAAYFGGVAGINGRVDDENTSDDESATGTITSATNEGNVIAVNADYVGGIVGHNTVNGVLDGMGNSNDGRVEGATYVGGVAGKNDAAITGAVNDMVGIENNGVVIAHKGGAGGIFGENTGDIKYAELTNNGIVSGTYSNNDVAGTGGIFGVNNGVITYSSLKNNIGGQVSGTQNVGGLIGINTGTITGGRIEADGTDADYYKYQIYNNGVINVGTWTDNNGNGVVDADEIKDLAEGVTSTNIGGLIGHNADETASGGKKGSLTAGYNTGAINAENSSNVGGIVGKNEGIVDQVFNTVMTPNGEDTIIGGNNVGGLVGNNSGTLSNAYNTTEVKSTNSGVVGNAVGVNGTNGTINNIYANNISGNLIGNAQGTINNAYSFSSEDEGSKVVKFVDDVDTDKDGIKDRVDKDSYTGFDFTDDWKNYDGSVNPLLKVFLTKVTVDNTNLPNLVYNTQNQDLDIDSLTGNGGAFSAEDGFEAYQNNKNLIQNTDFEHKNAGTYDNWLYSDQIAAGSTDNSFNPNNLGYDIEFEADIDKAQITVDLNQVDRVYGDTAIAKGEYGFNYDFNDINNVLTDEDKVALRAELDTNKVLGMNSVDITKDDEGLVNNGTKTNDAGSHSWIGTVNIADSYKGNYEFVLTDEQKADNQSIVSQDKASITTVGDSVVQKANIIISADDRETLPGVMPDFTGTDINDVLVNGDTISDSIYGYGVDLGTDITTNGTHTIGIYVNGTYYELSNPNWSSIAGLEFFKNYNVKFEHGTLTVDSEIMPDLPDNWPNNRWDYLFGDNPFDRNENFRERKAEVNFVDGAMEI